MSARARRAVTSFALLAAGLVGGGVVLGPAPAAEAATCTSAGGVSVVVDYRELGGATVTACAPDGGGKSATAIFASVGVQLSYAQRAPGFVCRVNGQPAADPCMNTSPANAYWGLWWADGSKASWTYSSYGAGALTVPAGGSVGWSWQQDRENSGSVPPSVAPPVIPAEAPTTSPTPSPTPSSSSSPSPTASPTGGSGGSGGGSGSSSSPSPSPTGSGGGTSGGSGSGSSGGSGSSPQASPSGSPSSPSESPSASESPRDSQAKAGSRKKSDDGTSDDESPGDSEASEDAEATDPGSESPSDSGASTAPEAGQPTADEPARVPAAITWSIVGLLAIAIAGSAVVARRRRGV